MFKKPTSVLPTGTTLKVSKLTQAISTKAVSTFFNLTKTWSPLSLIEPGLGRLETKLIMVAANDLLGGVALVMTNPGINTRHVEFRGRAVLGYNALKDTPFEDTFGHGTMMAGIVGSTTYGVAKNCTLVAVKVISGKITTVAAILDGFNWTVNRILRSRQQSKAVINLSLSGPKSPAMNAAIDEAVRKGITIIAAVGNQRRNASAVSPGSAMGAITVSATNEEYSRWKGGNWGAKVDIFAPGVNIKSTETGSTTAVGTASGTSFASAYVAGLVVYFKGMRSLPDDAATKKCLYGTATRNVVYGPAGGRNLFAYNGNIFQSFRSEVK